MRDRNLPTGSATRRFAVVAALAAIFALIIERLRRPDVVWHPGDDGGDLAGDREPRVPLPTAGAGAAAVPLPPEE